MAHQAGFDNVVASLGTALTPGPGRAAHPLREEDRPGLRRRRGRREGRDVRGDQALEALIGQLAGADTGVELDEVRRRPPARRQGPRRGRPRDARPVARGGPDGPADRRLPHRLPRPPGRPARRRAARPASSTRSLPTLRAVPNPVMRDAYLQRDPHAVRRRGADAPRGAPPAARRRSVPTRTAAGSPADAVLASADALPVDRDPPRRSRRSRSELLRLMLLAPGAAAPGGRRARARPAALDAGPRAVPGDRPPAGPERPGLRPAVLDRRRCMAGARRRDRGPLAQAFCARAGPDLARPSRRSGSSTTSTAACSSSRRTSLEERADWSAAG